jgi:Domain of unknown function DUF29
MTHPSYDTDFYAWTQTQAAALRAKDWASVILTIELEDFAKQRYIVRERITPQGHEIIDRGKL